MGVRGVDRSRDSTHVYMCPVFEPVWESDPVYVLGVGVRGWLTGSGETHV